MTSSKWIWTEEIKERVYARYNEMKIKWKEHKEEAKCSYFNKSYLCTCIIYMLSGSSGCCFRRSHPGRTCPHVGLQSSHFCCSNRRWLMNGHRPACHCMDRCWWSSTIHCQCSHCCHVADSLPFKFLLAAILLHIFGSSCLFCSPFLVKIVEERKHSSVQIQQNQIVADKTKPLL